MIEVINDKERNLKNVKQIGTPREENKIYLENQAYRELKNGYHKEKNVFVLMGHTERMSGCYATFIESVIHVKDMEFSGNTPCWNNSAWSAVFRVIKNYCEDMIIVGWAIDIKGMSLKLSPELERVHREHFGGVHQLLFLLDSLEQEESFYVYKENKLVEKDGFYIYHQTRKKEKMEVVKTKEPVVEVEVDIVDRDIRKGGKYRQLIQEQGKTKVKGEGNLGVAIAVAMLVFVIGVGVYENGSALFGYEDSVQTNLIEDTEVATTQTSIDTFDHSGEVIEEGVIPVIEDTQEKE